MDQHHNAPFRSAEFHEHCIECDAPTSEICARCQTPQCRDHLIGEPAFCFDCEETYMVKPAGQRSWTTTWLMVVSVLVFLAMLSYSPGLLFVAGLSFLLPMPLVLDADRRAESDARKLFARQRRRPLLTR